MKKTIFTVMMVVILLMSVGVVNATSVSELKDYILGSHVIGGKSVTLTATQKAQVERYFDTHTITEEQSTQVMSKINEVAKEVEKISDLEKITSSQKNQLLSMINEAAAVLNLTVSYDSSDKAIIVYEDGAIISTISLENTGLVQTGSSRIQSVCYLGGIAIIAVALVYTIKKRSK
ncbi:MAG: hypothetical protein Q4G05_04055 [Clostridia bacterium]|nr:hypothetical protein [Clostridia bacterium]